MNKSVIKQLPPKDESRNYIAWIESFKVLIKTNAGEIHLARYHYNTDPEDEQFNCWHLDGRDSYSIDDVIEWAYIDEGMT